MKRTTNQRAFPRRARQAAAALVCILALYIGLAPATARATSGDASGFSLGLILGDPSGVTLRNGFGAHSAIQAHLGFSAFPGDGIVVMVDWTYDAWDLMAKNRTAALWFFFGAGAKGAWFTGRYFYYKHQGRHSFSDRSHFGLGARGLVGLRLAFRNSPFDLFLEVAPIGLMVVVPNAAAYYDFDAALGFRYRF